MDSHSNSNTWFAVSVGLMGLIVGYGIASVHAGWVNAAPQVAQVIPSPSPSDAPAPLPPPPPSSPAPPVDADDHVRGNPDAKVTVIEYSDFECPFCKRHHPTILKLLETYGDDVNVVFRHFPLSFHQNAQKEAEGSECAAELGGNAAFWKFHDAIFEQTSAGGTGFALDRLVPLAKEIGLSEKKFKDCLDSGKYAKKIADNMNAGSAAGVNGTPGNFVINNETKEQKEVSGAVPFENFKSIIDPMLGK